MTKTREENLISKIRKEIESRNIRQPFAATEFEFLKPTSLNFIWKHSDQNTKLKGIQYFTWVSRGRYKLK